ncbi:MAG: prepilin-type N-terminal cleavage/methylation domain-containing protein [Rickettsiales bacterium]|nr:prepilin-type N-terminal cleavage/methylation domain-containing protein [Rickettsiales bacterium]
MKNNTKGFSLIELSIVLIIIGLLIAGITGGASLIKSAELRSTISEVRNYQTAVNAFYTEKGYLPGTNEGTTSQMNLLYSGTAWHELNTAKITDFDATATTAAFTASTSNSLTGKMKGSIYLLGYISTYTANSNVVNGNSLILASATGTSTTGTVAPGAITAGLALRPSVAKQIDDKMDDGKPASGKVLALGGITTADCQNGSGTTPSSSTYNDTLTTNLCSLAFKLGV